MVDRDARNQLIETIEAFLDDRIKSFDLEERIFDLESDDPTVNEVIFIVYHFYSDFADHNVRLSKPQWDYLQRLLLVLKSDAKVRSKKVKRWSWDSAVAWGALSVSAALALMLGWGYQLILLLIPLTLLSLFIMKARDRRWKAVQEAWKPDELACQPFESSAQIRRILGKVPGFRKRRYRAEIEERMMEPLNEPPQLPTWIGWPLAIFGYCLISPLVLFFQGFGAVEDTEYRVTEA